MSADAQPLPFTEDEAVARLTARRRRDKPTVPERNPQALVVLTQRIVKAEARMKTLRTLVLATILLTVLCLAGLATVLLAEREEPSLDDTRQMLRETVQLPVERLEKAVERLERKLP